MLGHYSAGFTLDTYAHVTTSGRKSRRQRPWRAFSPAVYSPVQSGKIPVWLKKWVSSQGAKINYPKKLQTANNPLESDDSSGLFWEEALNLRPPGYELLSVCPSVVFRRFQTQNRPKPGGCVLSAPPRFFRFWVRFWVRHALSKNSFLPYGLQNPSHPHLLLQSQYCSVYRFSENEEYTPDPSGWEV